MDEEDVLDLDNSFKVVRKYRKKLRQIERLEQLEGSGKELCEEEIIKVKKKADIRSRLQRILLAINQRDESFNSTKEDVVNEAESTEDEHATTCDAAAKYTSSDAATEDQEENVQEEQEIIPSEEPPTKKIILDESAISTQTYVQVPASQIPVTERSKKPHSKLRKTWRNKFFEVVNLEGHNDIICDVDADCDWLVSGSRDTSVKLWELSSNKELRNMSGHTGTVTCVKMLSESDSDRLRELVTSESDELTYDISVKCNNKERLLLTASTDCSIKLWMLPQGYCIKSIYNYSPITSMLYSSDVVFAGSDSGKLTSYNIISGRQICDVMIHENMITSLQCNVNTLMSTSLDGNLKLWEFCDVDLNRVNLDSTIQDEIEVRLKHAISDCKGFVEGRQILSSCFSEQMVIFGDDGINLKVLDMDTEMISKYPNHRAATGFTDGLVVFSDLLFTTSYDLDTGQGCLNVRTMKDEAISYLATFSHREFPRLTCLTIDRSSQTTCLATGGARLLVFRETTNQEIKDSSFDTMETITLRGRNITELGKPPLHSDVESDYTEDEGTDGSSWWWSKPVETGSKKVEDNGESDSDSDVSQESSEELVQTESGWKMWCSVL